MKIVVSGGAGFIGSNLVHHLLKTKHNQVLTIDKLTYAGRLENLAGALDNKKHIFMKKDVCDQSAISNIINNFKPDIIFHLAAESHVDRSIDCANSFIKTNIMGSYSILESAFNYWCSIPTYLKNDFKFVQVSTDEVFGEIQEGCFNENSPYLPTSPYSASKASADMLIRSYYKTFGFPAIIANCSNNYGPRQYPEKLIPLCILNAIQKRNLPIYGNGLQVRDWLHVQDHVEALCCIATSENLGSSYCIGANCELTNIEVVQNICDILDELIPDVNIKSRRYLIKYVEDRLGHDKRYAIDSKKLRTELGWEAKIDFITGLRETIIWYLNNQKWWSTILQENDALQRQGTNRLKKESLI